MRHIMVCISGFSGVGKDECAGHLRRKYGAVHTGLADPAKRHMADVYGFTTEQLFGPSAMRNAGDVRYPKNDFRKFGLRPVGLGEILHPGENNLGLKPKTMYFACEARHVDGVDEVPGYADAPRKPGRLGSTTYLIEEGHPRFWLSPREALQRYCNLMNDIYLDTWVRKGVRVQRQLAEIAWEEDGIRVMRFQYDRMTGLVNSDPVAVAVGTQPLPAKSGSPFVTCFSDFRHVHEITYVRGLREDGLRSVVVRVKHPRIDKPPYDHRSETEQATIPDSEFDHVIMNDGTLDDLYAKIDACMAKEAEW